MTDEEKERLRPHFEKEDMVFLIRCMKNRFNDCTGCQYYSLCNEEMNSNNELPIPQKNELPNNRTKES